MTLFEVPAQAPASSDPVFPAVWVAWNEHVCMAGHGVRRFCRNLPDSLLIQLAWAEHNAQQDLGYTPGTPPVDTGRREFVIDWLCDNVEFVH